MLTRSCNEDLGAKRVYETPELRDLGDVKTTTQGTRKTFGVEEDLDVPDLGSGPSQE